MTEARLTTGFRCIRCGTRYPIAQDLFGCPACETQVPANLELEYGAGVLDGALLKKVWADRKPGLWRYRELLPVAAAGAVSLGEGGTPLIACARLGEAVGLPGLMAKNESQNPTWSFKDRLASVAVSWARDHGRPGIAISSSGNAGAAAAAYAARAGMPCIVFTTRAFPGGMQRFMRSYGAMVVAAPTGPGRWVLNRAVAREWGWLPMSNTADPPVGSHPSGIEGCKTIAYEIAQDLGWRAPDAVVIPVAYGDSIAGIHRGFKELLAAGVIDRLPRLIAAETYPSLSGALEQGAEGPVPTEGGDSKAFSVATPRGTYQALRAIRESEGSAIAVSDAEIFDAHRRLREREGLFVEFSSAMPLAAAERLAAAGELNPTDTVVMLITSSGVKDSELTAPGDELPLAEPNLAALQAVLKDRFGFAA